MTVLNVLDPLPLICATVYLCITSSTKCPVGPEVAIIDLAISMYEAAHPVSTVPAPLALIKGTVFEGLETVAVALPAKPLAVVPRTARQENLRASFPRGSGMLEQRSARTRFATLA
eukprot:CAMPEP_0194494728 /NCGR_PEP_ID=MMETSP0253-20130528/12549_1 /TAXON_ID=2966 /ORGANISM="Noctiluca scintillans" /LENGTH=115 /DNA_ID=CAMNT_0039335889 /DNA_START=81 /DNA_END=425 /DNA_ORIENTATION=-